MRVLLVSLFYPPLNNIASFRIKAFKTYLEKNGIAVDVITRYYDDDQRKGNSMFEFVKEPKNMQLSYIRESNIVFTNYSGSSPEKKMFEKLPPVLKGVYAYFKFDIYSYGWLRFVEEAFDKEFSNNQYDFIIASYGPPIAILAARLLSQKYGIPFVIDFRDAFLTESDKGYHRQIKSFLQKRYLKNSKAIFFATPGMEQYFRAHSGKRLAEIPGLIVMNGIEASNNSSVNANLDQAIIEKFDKIGQRATLILLHTGSIYIDQDIEFFIREIEKYNIANNLNIRIVLIGTSDMRDQNSFASPVVDLLQKTNLETSLYLQKKSDFLLLPVWKARYTGFSGKLFEYLDSGKPVLVSPGMQEDVIEFTKDFENIFFLNEPGDLGSLLTKRLSGKAFKIDPEKYNTARLKLNREYWVSKIPGFLNDLK